MSERAAFAGVPVTSHHARSGHFLTAALSGLVCVLTLASGCGDDRIAARPEEMSVVGGAPKVDPARNTVLDRTGAGPGTFEPTSPYQCDSYIQKAATRVDVLWVIDNSGSMGPKQQLVKDNFELFMTRLSTPDENGVTPDYHIGVTTMDTYNAAEGGRLINKAGLSKPWIGSDTCTGSCNPVEAFRQNANVGTRGSRAGPPKGLLAATLALTPPLSTGANTGFLRDDAKLIVVMVSDAEDTSCSPVKTSPIDYGCEDFLQFGSVDYYTRIFRGLKGQGREEDVKLYAFVGTTRALTVPDTNGEIEGCLAANGSPSDPFQYAWYADRYVRAANAVTGPQGAQSICSASFEKIIGDFGTTLQTSFFLTRKPVDNTTQCSVTKDSVTTNIPAADFSVDTAASAVRFDSEKAPTAGSVVKCCYSVQ